MLHNNFLLSCCMLICRHSHEVAAAAPQSTVGSLDHYTHLIMFVFATLLIGKWHCGTLARIFILYIFIFSWTILWITVPVKLSMKSNLHVDERALGGAPADYIFPIASLRHFPMVFFHPHSILPV